MNPGANATVLPPSLGPLLDSSHSKPSLIIMQLETPLETVLHVCQHATKFDVPVLLNPAPAIPLPDSIYPAVKLLVVNESEASLLSGVPVGSTDEEVVEQAYRAADVFTGRGCPNVIVTLGALGAVVQCGTSSPMTAWRGAERLHIPAETVEVVDTTAAGDTFIGALAVTLARDWASSETRPTSGSFDLLVNAVQYAIRASAWTVARKGTWDAMPTAGDLV